MAKTKSGAAKPTGPQIAIDQVLGGFAAAPARGDALRAVGLGDLAQVKRAKLVQVRRERARLAVRHGEDSAEVARVDAQLAGEHRWLVGLRAEAGRAAVPVVERDPRAWLIHGHVRSLDGLPRAKAEVGLFAVAARDSKPLLTTRSDDAGYFMLRLDRSDGAGREEVIEIEAAEREKLAAAKKEQYERMFVAALEHPVLLGVTLSGQTGTVMDNRPFHPRAGAIAYRDLTVSNAKDDGESCQLKTRLLGNASSRELHDLENEKPGCQIGEIRPDHRFYFRSEEQAQALGYDFCAYCYGKTRSRR